MATKEKTEVASVKTSAQLPAGMADMDELMRDAGVGVESMSMDDIAVPYLYILQSGSPQVNEDADTYIKGAKPGMFFNNVSNEVYDGREVGLTVIPCAYERKYVEWIDRDSGGGGYVADHDIDSGIMNETTPNEKGVPVLGNGHLVIETAYHYVYFRNPLTGTWEEIIIPMKSTMLKKSRRWNKTLMATLIPGTSSRAPRWLYPYQLKTVKETKSTNTWSNFDITRLEEMVNADQYRSAKKFAELMQSGLLVKAKESNVGSVVDTGGDDEDGGDNGRNKVGGGKDEMPF
jgi:hypothetical protein